MQNILIVIIALLVFTSCEAGKRTENGDAKPAEGKDAATSEQSSPGPDARYALEITPKDPVRSSTISLIPSGFDLSQATFEWLSNNSIVEGANAFQLSLSGLKKGDVVQARAYLGGQIILSDPITILNSPPEVSKVEVIPDSIASGGSLRVDVTGKDVDGDALSFAYEWTRNDAPAGKENRIDGALKRGDFVTVKIIPFDGSDHGPSVILRREAGNMPPMIEAHKEFSFKGNVYTYQVKAYDPDGDKLIYALKSEIPGVAIDPASGLVTWTVPDEYIGAKAVTVTVTDGSGGAVEYTVNFIMSRQ